MPYAIAAVFAIMSFIIWYLDGERTTWIQQASAAQTGLAVANAKIEHDRETQNLIKANQGQLDAANKLHDADRQEWANERKLLSGQIERKALESPKLYGDDFDLQLRSIMCEAAAGNNSDAIRACGDRAAIAGPAPVALTLTITREEAERRIEACEAYELGEETTEEIQARYPLSRQDACDWAVTGFTFNGGENVLQWLRNYVAYSRSIRNHADSRGQIIDILTRQTNDSVRGTAPEKVE